MMRLFVALDLPEELRQRIAMLQAGLPGARWVAPENLHVTLRFIGDARGPEDREWWTEVRRAWAIELPPKPKAKAETEAETASKSEAKAEGEAAEPAPAPAPAPGKIAKTDTKGVRCTNPNW